MIINPILPIWVMAIISVALLVPMRKGIFNYIRQIIIVLILFAINLRPMLPDGITREVTRDYKVLFVIDNTISMLAEDEEYDGITRLERVKEDLEHVVNRLEGASYSVIKFDNEPRQMIPFTTDAQLCMQSIKSLKAQTSLYARGTSLAMLREPLIKILSQFPDDNIYLFLITDGENTTEDDILPLNMVSNYIKGGAVLGYGTDRGGPMKVISFYGDENPPEYLMYYDESNYEYTEAISRIDEDNLKKIASELMVNYVHMTKTSDINGILNSISSEVAGFELEEVEQRSGYSDIYFYFVIPLVLILIFDFIYYKKRSWKAKTAR